jgi:hypothetical protein
VPFDFLYVSHSENNSARYFHKHPPVFMRKYSLFLSDFNQTSNFMNRFSKLLKHEISRKSVQWGPNFSMRIDIDRQTDKHDEGNSRFSQFCIRA